MTKKMDSSITRILLFAKEEANILDMPEATIEHVLIWAASQEGGINSLMHSYGLDSTSLRVHLMDTRERVSERWVTIRPEVHETMRDIKLFALGLGSDEALPEHALYVLLQDKFELIAPLFAALNVHRESLFENLVAHMTAPAVN